MRVLHVLDAGAWRWNAGARAVIPDGRADDAALACAAIVERSSDRSSTLVLGPRWFAARAAGLGLRVDSFATPAVSRPELAWRALRRMARGMGAEAVCCWSAAAERTAMLALGRDVPLVRVGLEAPTEAVPGFLRPRRRVAVNLRETLPVRAADATKLRSMREGLRRQLKLGDSDSVVLLLGSGPDASAVRFTFLLGLARYIGDTVVGLVPMWSDGLSRSRDFERRLNVGIRMVDSALPLRELAASADLAVCIGSGHSSTWLADFKGSRFAVAQCLAAGVPVIAGADAGVEDLYPVEVREECLAHITMPPEIARLLIRLIERPERRRAVAQACRERTAAMNFAPQAAAAVEEACQQASATGGWGMVIATQVVTAPQGDPA